MAAGTGDRGEGGVLAAAGEGAGAGGACADDARKSFDPCGVRPVLCSAVPGGEPGPAETAVSGGDLAAAEAPSMAPAGLDTCDRLLRSRLNLLGTQGTCCVSKRGVSQLGQVKHYKQLHW